MINKNRLKNLVLSTLVFLAFSTGFITVGEAANGEITGISGREVEISLGKADGIVVGTQLKIIRHKEIKRGDRVLRTDTLNVGELEILTVKETSSLGKMLRSFYSIKEGDIALFTSSAPAVEATPEPPVAPAPEPVVEETIPEPVPVPAPEKKPEPVITPAVEKQPEPAPVVGTRSEPVPVVDPAPVEAEKETPQATRGILNINTQPSGADLFLNGKALGTSPKAILDQEPGKYQVTATKDGYYPGRQTADVKAGQTTNITIRLKAFEGRLTINSRPKSSSVVIGGKSRGKTPLKIRLKPGSYTVLLQKAGYRQLKKKVRVSGTMPTKIDLVLDKVGAPAIEGMLYIPGGEFVMGSNSGNLNEKPAHKVTVSPFYIDKYEVTNAQFRKFVDATGHIEPAFWNDDDLNKPSYPVVGVSWEDAAAYAEWTGKRLPTEAEWEMAASGFDSRTYPWGNDYKTGFANKYGKADGYRYTAPVKSFEKGASAYGVVNMAGNVWEWCADFYAENYYAKSPGNNPKGPAKGEMHAMRGGSWEDSEKSLRTSNRSAGEANYYNNNLGFRCAK